MGIEMVLFAKEVKLIILKMTVGLNVVQMGNLWIKNPTINLLKAYEKRDEI